MVDIACFGYESDVEFAHWMTREIGVAPVPGSSFFVSGENRHIRLNFAKKSRLRRRSVLRDGFDEFGLWKMLNTEEAIDGQIFVQFGPVDAVARGRYCVAHPLLR